MADAAQTVRRLRGSPAEVELQQHHIERASDSDSGDNKSYPARHQWDPREKISVQFGRKRRNGGEVLTRQTRTGERADAG